MVSADCLLKMQCRTYGDGECQECEASHLCTGSLKGADCGELAAMVLQLLHTANLLTSKGNSWDLRQVRLFNVQTSGRWATQP